MCTKSQPCASKLSWSFPDEDEKKVPQGQKRVNDNTLQIRKEISGLLFSDKTADPRATQSQIDPVIDRYKSEIDRIHNSLAQRNIEKIDFSPIKPAVIQEESRSNGQGPTSLTFFQDGMEILLNHAPPMVGTVVTRPLQLISAYTENAGSNNKIRDMSIDIASETGVVASIGRVLGGATPASLALLTSHAAQKAREYFPGPSLEELGQQAISKDRLEREQAQEWLRARAQTNTLALPADAIQAIEQEIKNILNQKSNQSN